MGREDSGSGAVEKASTVDTGGVGVELNLSSHRLPCAQEVATATRKSTRRMMRAGMIYKAKGKGVIESKGQGRGWGRGKRTNNSGADGGRAPTRARR